MIDSTIKSDFRLSIINLKILKDPGINVDSQYKYEKEKCFNSRKIAWKFSW